MTRALKNRSTLYGFLAIWIVLFHTFRRIGMPYIPVVTNIVGIGNFGVDVFFFFSGLCLALSAKKHNYAETGWKAFYRKRFIRILIPYLLICIPYYAWSALVRVSGGIARKFAEFLFDLSSASFWLKGTQTTWYAFGIIVFYLVFPLIYTFLAKTGRRGKLRGIILVAALIAFAVFSFYMPILNKSMIVWARLPIFTIGVIMAINCDLERTPNAVETVAAAIVLAALGTIISISEISASFTLPQVFRFLLYIPMTLAFIAIVSGFGRKIMPFEWIGGFSLEVYLVHITLLHPLKYYGVINAVGYWLYLILPVVSVFIAWIVSLIANAVSRKLNARR